MHRLIDCTPFLGGARAYRTAVENYHIAKLKQDSTAMAEARSEAAAALGDLAVDFGLVGSLKLGARSLQKLSGGFLLARAARHLGLKGVDPIKPLARRAVTNETGQFVMDNLFEGSRHAFLTYLRVRAVLSRQMKSDR